MYLPEFLARCTKTQARQSACAYSLPFNIAWRAIDTGFSLEFVYASDVTLKIVFAAEAAATVRFAARVRARKWLCTRGIGIMR